MSVPAAPVAPPVAGRAEIVADAPALAVAAAQAIAAAIRAGGTPFRLSLAGGSTPRAAYAHLAALDDVPWNKVELFFGDERFVPPDHPDSNYRMVRETLLVGDRVRPCTLMPMPTDGDPDQAARRYEETLRQQYGASELERAVPLFDLMLLGLGADGHTASLIPGQPVLSERTRWVAPVPKGREEIRLTLTYPALESSRLTVFLVAGADKRSAVARVRAGDVALPAGNLHPQGQVLWLLDREAAA